LDNCDPLAIALDEVDNLGWSTAEATSLAFSTGPVWSSADIERFVACLAVGGFGSGLELLQ
jgi:hypothetical protein